MTNFWQGKKVLITGHTGFKGSWLSLWLQLLGAELVGYSLPAPTEPSLYELASVATGMKSVIGDIRDFSKLQQLIQDQRPEIVFHLAAQPLVRASYSYPVETYSTNVMGTVNLLEALRLAGSAKAVVNVTTDKCYENPELGNAFHEEDRLGGHDPYSNSKACSELVTFAYRASFFKQGLASARAGNVIGGGDWAQDRLIPDLVSACMKGEAAAIRHPGALRPWQHVLEPLSGYLLLAQRLYEAPTDFSEAWNFGPELEDVKPVSWIADYLVKAWQGASQWNHEKVPGPHEATYLQLACEKAKTKLGWKPHWNLEKGLDATVSWYQAFQNKNDLRTTTLSQIKTYMEQL